MKKFTFLFSYAPKSFISKIIQWRLGTSYSHVAVLTEPCPITRNPEIYHATHGFVYSMSADRFYKSNKVVKAVTIECDFETYARGLNFLRNQTGKSYGFLSFVGSTVKILRKMGFGADGDASFICSEYAYDLLDTIRPEETNTNLEASDYVDPETFEEIVLEVQKKIKGQL